MIIILQLNSRCFLFLAHNLSVISVAVVWAVMAVVVRRGITVGRVGVWAVAVTIESVAAVATVICGTVVVAVVVVWVSFGFGISLAFRRCVGNCQSQCENCEELHLAAEIRK